MHEKPHLIAGIIANRDYFALRRYEPGKSRLGIVLGRFLRGRMRRTGGLKIQGVDEGILARERQFRIPSRQFTSQVVRNWHMPADSMQILWMHMISPTNSTPPLPKHKRTN